MTDLTAMSALALAVQSAPESYATLTSSDRTTCANLTWRPQAVTAQNPEYTGSIHRPGDIILGATYDVSYDILLRGPGGADVPSADEFILGRVLRSVGFTENLVSAAIPVAAEALGGSGNTTSVAALGTTASSTDDIYKGLAISLASLGTIGQAAALAMISDYVGTGKLASIAQTHTGAYSGDYQIPKQAAYTLAASGTPPVLTQRIWQGNRYLEFGDMAPSSARLILPTASREGGSDLPRISVTYTGDLIDYGDEAAPQVVASLALPPFRGGKLHVDGLAMGGSSLSLDLGLRVGFPPNPNNASGSDPAQLVETRRVGTLDLNQVAKSVKDFIALAQAQSEHSIQALYGLASGNYIGFMASGARFNFPETQAGGDFFTTTKEFYVDSADKTISLVFPYY